MCLVGLSFKQVAQYPLVLLANRDEFYARPTAPVEFWPDAPQILAGRDLTAKGTWGGVNRRGQFILLTNFRDPSETVVGKRSRGEIAASFLKAGLAPLTFLKKVRQEIGGYASFNLLLGSPAAVWFYSSRHPTEIKVLDSGVYGLSNATLNDPWPKVVRIKSFLATNDPTDVAFVENSLRFLKNSEAASDRDLPRTGVPPEWEKKLSPVFIRTPEYGTRSSMVVRFHLSGRVNVSEVTYHNESESRRDFQFEVEG